AVEDPAVQSLLDLQKGSKASKLKSLRKKKQPVAGEGSSAAHNKYYSPSDTVSDVTLYSSSSDNSEESTNENDDAYESNMDLSDDNPHGDDDDASYISGASEVPLGTHVDVLATKSLMQEMFPDENAHRIPSLPAKKIAYPTTYPQPSLLQVKAKKLMQKAKKNIRKFNFKKAVIQKFKEYDQKLEALTNFNVYKAFEKAVQEKLLIEIKKLLPTLKVVEPNSLEQVK
ncbi:hypothetical protein Tco_1261155, partial [Tanacetum coccineum]